MLLIARRFPGAGPAAACEHVADGRGRAELIPPPGQHGLRAAEDVPGHLLGARSIAIAIAIDFYE